MPAKRPAIPTLRTIGGRLWPVKILAKMVLARLPLGYRLWRRLGLFRHGRMDEADYALRIFRQHAERAFPDGLMPGFTALELGPGDSAASALTARAHGAARVLLVDVGDFAERRLEGYRQLAEYLRAAGLPAPDIDRCRDFTEMLARCGAEYLTNGIESLRGVADESVDFLWSHSVLEHVRRRDFERLLRETHRILKVGGRASHNIDLQDHLAHSLNNLRFPERVWESEFMAASGFYTNRLRFSEIRDTMTAIGFTILEAAGGRWPRPPLPRRALGRQFQQLSDDDLLTRTAYFLLGKG